MAKNIKILKLATGEEIMGEVLNVSEANVTLKNVVRVMVVPSRSDPNTPTVAFAPWANDIAMMENLESPHTITENYTFRRIYEDCQNAEEEFYVMYIHTKGITSCMRLMSKNCILAQSFKNYYYWRQFLNWGVIKRWRSCVDALDDNDVAGVNFFSSPSPHFSGNFWWAKSSYIKTLPNPATKDWWYALKEKTSNIWLKGASDRFRDEQWVCSNPDVKVYKVIDMDEGNNPAGKYLPTTMYDPD